MDPVLVDTSVWVDFFNGRENNQTNILRDYLENEHTIFICPLIIQEILQGIRNDEDYKRVKINLFNLDILQLEPVQSSIGAADLYRMLRKKGVTINKSNDCMIAFYAIHFGIHLLHNDKDFELIKKHSDLKVMK